MYKPDKDCIVVDIKAHIGVYTIKTAKVVGNKGLVLGIEPDPENYNLLIKNIKINNYTNIFAVNLALAYYESRGKLYTFSDSDAASLKTKSNRWIMVHVIKLDNLLNRLKITKIDIIKIDAEGMELEILMGAQQLISKSNTNLNLIIAAYHSTNEVRDIRYYLQNHSFAIDIIYQNEGPYIYARKLVETEKNI